MATIPTLPITSHPSYNAIRSLRWRLRHPEKYKQSTKRQASRIAVRQHAEVAKRKNAGCADCYIKYAHWILQFDHVPARGYKLRKVNPASRFTSYRKFVEELDKCDVVCANCHANRTYFRLKKEK